ncbi:beta-lactamase family protein [Elizabethkingia anophelis]|uniref:serine hydrolase domain-containing protein n=1 Tax=Elizabethkingia TaxID=308865 RepID=UPI000739820B|nr:MULTISPECIES: serine hydrolase domain-containing protein [Elizabethkingia]KUF45632.1 serine hydrolase [Elizabethkingia anophelis]MCT3645442.1 beta-lactamase family protein [Elizabethkingia anophelis]MCT3652382.1 beta-lactamase family protein [Elizabethkingia anophelis]MCT3656609.1 beta-lactamase family protein [Elizabethkingia anophelis]MCT3659701.1 beta-lactamase family protein [Elizabethkingia anophelis]
MKLKIYFLTLFLAGCYAVNGQKNKNYKSEIDSIVIATQPIEFNGVVMIAQNGKLKYSIARGFKDFEKKIPLNTMTDQYEIMSNSKQITAVLLLQQVDSGIIDLQSPIRKYLPELTQKWADTVTVHQLLNHTHGITDTEKPLAFKPGTRFKYGNLSYIMLGKILENKTGQAYKQLAEGLFRKLKMSNTYCYDKNNKHNLVSAYMNKDNNFVKTKGSFLNDDILPAAGIISTPHDLALWNDALYKGRLLKPQTLKQMLTPSTSSQHQVFGEKEMGFGYNVRIIDEAGLHYYGVTGLGDGFTCLNLYFPDTDVSLIILENQMPEKSEYWSYKEAAIKNAFLKSSLVRKGN